MPVYNGWEFPNIKVDPPNERYLKIILGPETTGYEDCTVFFSHIPVGGTTGMHTHGTSDELMYFTGRGLCLMNGEEVPLETDSVVLAPKGAPHECRNASKTETLKLFCVFLPAIKVAGAMDELLGKTRQYLEEEEENA